MFEDHTLIDFEDVLGKLHYARDDAWSTTPIDKGTSDLVASLLFLQKLGVFSERNKEWVFYLVGEPEDVYHQILMAGLASSGVNARWYVCGGMSFPRKIPVHRFTIKKLSRVPRHGYLIFTAGHELEREFLNVLEPVHALFMNSFDFGTGSRPSIWSEMLVPDRTMLPCCAVPYLYTIVTPPYVFKELDEYDIMDYLFTLNMYSVQHAEVNRYRMLRHATSILPPAFFGLSEDREVDLFMIMKRILGYQEQWSLQDWRCLVSNCI